MYNYNIVIENEIIQYVEKRKRGIKWNQFPLKYIEYLTNKFPGSTCNRELYLRLKHNIMEIPKCPICGNLCKYCGGINTVYSSTCGNKECINKLRQQHVNETFIKKYGKIGFVNKEKSKQTKLKRYGNENFTNIKKRKQTCLKKYGFDSPVKSDKVKNKIKKTCLDKYGVENVYSSNIIKEKIKKTKLEKYGNEYFVNGDKISKTYQNKSNKEKENIVNKIKKTKFKLYNDENYNNIEKRKQTCLEKYGVDHNWKIPEEHLLTNTEEAKNKKKQTSLKNWGTEYPSQSKIIKQKVKETLRKNNKLSGTSIIEQKLFTLLKEVYPDSKIHYIDERYNNFECDYYIPSKDLFIEYQGHQSHGGHPYNKNDENDINLAKWIKNTFGNNTAFVKLDPLKRYIAKENNLNWIEFWNAKEFKLWLNKEKESF